MTDPTPQRNPRSGVIQRHGRNKVRHVAWGPLNDPMPLCASRSLRAYGWMSSSADDTHELPLCRDCRRRAIAITRAVLDD